MTFHEDKEIIEILNALAVNIEYVEDAWWMTDTQLAVKCDGHIARFKVHRYVSKKQLKNKKTSSSCR